MLAPTNGNQNPKPLTKWLDDGSDPHAWQVASELVRALCHLPGELPAVRTLEEIVDRSAWIVEQGPDGCLRYSRDQWLRELTMRALDDVDARCSWFIDELDRISVTMGSETSIYLVCARRLTYFGVVVERELVRCSLNVQSVGGARRVTRLISSR